MTHHTTASVGVRAGALLAGAALIALFASPVGAVDSGRINPARTVDAAKVNGNACRPLTAQKAAVHTAAAKREATVARLISSLQDRRDPWSMNAGQISALQSASVG